MNELETAIPSAEDATPEVQAPSTDQPAPAPEAPDAQEEKSEEVTLSFHEMDKETLMAYLKKILDEENMRAHREVASIKQAFFALRSKEIDEELKAYLDAGNPADAFASMPDPLEAEFKELLSRFKEQRVAYLEAEEARRQENLTARLAILDQLREMAEDMDNLNVHFPRFQQLQQDFRAIKEIPAGAETDSWKNYQAVCELFYDRLKMNKELRDLDFKKNLEAKRALIEEAHKLETEADVIAAFRRLQDLHSQWREIGPVAKEHREVIWDEFKGISTIVNKRHQDFFERRKAAEQEAEDAKNKLIEELQAIKPEEIKSFQAWDAATKQVIDIQARWKELGFASRKVNNQLYSQYRKICDDFFNCKAEYYRASKAEFANNLARKTALCEQAEALQASGEDTKTAIAKIVELQNEWKKIGSVGRRQSDAIWARFQAACNYFFEARRKQHSEARREETANLEAKRAVIAKLRELAEQTDRDDVIKAVRELQAEWQQIGHVPFKMKDKLYAEYREVADGIYEKFDIRQSRARMANFANQMEELKGNDAKLNSERDRLFRNLEKKRSELKTFENNMGFFNVKSSAGNSMVAEMERRIKKIKEEIATLEQKIDMLDSNIGN